ncbi:uncharacterized protein B0H18DRAFT_972998 [Fomitopsis serialis]|uniref:uncharacterized protein n=1 Tax=Fomitopsis serialis TaxID=139415 RepID=UPI0020085BCB|nr:uncharacterized protein B0H18DRAFT_972998 [Neoantrodia serialis]KAH9936241.1 hypothetical protein B0H18DRAFT_972998 [Neoantrodia serialis]
MGLFTRRAEHLESTLPDSQSAVSFRALRARFYGNGKGKGKERDLDGDSATSSTASPSLSSPYAHSDKQSFVSARASDPRGLYKQSQRVASTTSISLARHAETVSEPTGPRPSTDVVTITLAQRLNELAAANSEGLLSDDEYRLLRQNLFERFASNSQIPSETPLVPISGGGHGAGGSRISISSYDRRQSSQFYVQSSRASSVQSKSSLTASIGGLLKRAASKTRRVVSSPSDLGDAASLFSTHSNGDCTRTPPRTLTSRASESSFRSGHDRARAPQLRPILTQSEPDGSNPRLSRGRKRSGSSAPPSAFPGTASILEPTSPTMFGEPMPSDDEVQSAKDIRHHIELVEAEGRRLLDAFNGLELSTLTRRHKRPHLRPTIPMSPSAESSSVHTNDAPSLHTTRDMDALSFKSGGSGPRTPSKRRSPSGPRKMNASTSTSSTTLTSQPSKTASRKGSISSISSRGRSGLSYPGLSPSYGMASSSSVNLARSMSHLPLETVAETEGPAGGHRKSSTEESKWTGATLAPDVPPLPGRGPKSPLQAGDEDIRAMETELADIRRRRVEVTARYEERLEYLRARLKGAELREKVMRK